MNRRDFMKTAAVSAAAVSAPFAFAPPARAAGEGGYHGLDKTSFRNLADVALRTARKLGASYADLRVCRYQNESIDTREDRVEGINSSKDVGFGVRVLLKGTWGFASSSTLSLAQVERTARFAVKIARANQAIQRRRVELETLPAYDAEWIMPMKTDPFAVSIEDKVKKLLAINAAAQQAGAEFCHSDAIFVKEEKFFASSYGSFLRQVRVRSFPSFTVTAVDKKTGRFETRQSFAPPRGSGYEYLEEYDLVGEAARAAEEAKLKHTAKPVRPGKKDLVIHPTNLWLTIHESVGHPSELDRALGYEANFAGTSFLTPDKLGKLKYGSDLVNIVGDRTQPGGLSTIGYDDDGVRTAGAEFHIIKNGRFNDYQMSVGFAKSIGRSRSNGCAFADSWDKFPLQRMPNISLQPGAGKVSIDELIDGVKDGIYIQGNGSWSIDQQRYNFQSGGQVFHEIKNGKPGPMLRDVAAELK